VARTSRLRPQLVEPDSFEGREGVLPDSETHFTLSDWTSPVYGRSDIGP
jgi:hypothetical protein